MYSKHALVHSTLGNVYFCGMGLRRVHMLDAKNLFSLHRVMKLLGIKQKQSQVSAFPKLILSHLILESVARLLRVTENELT